ncbi:hypothetical protein V2J09_003060 [Rumex salicifolius]
MGRKPCCSKEEVSRGAWSFQEDQILINYIQTHGQGKWRTLPLKAGLNRCGKSCRLRWLNYLRPDIKRGDISKDEEDLIIKLHTLLGNRWSLIAGRLPGRTDNEIKNYWNTNLVKRQCHPKSPSRKEPKQHQMPYTNKNNSHIIRTKAIRLNNVNQDQRANNIVHNHEQCSNETETSNDRTDVQDTNHFGTEEKDLPCFDMLVDANGIEIMIDDKVKEIRSEQSMEIDFMLELKKMASFLDVEDVWSNM